MAWDSSTEILASGTLTASGQSAGLDIDGVTARRGLVLFQMWVGAVTGTTPALDVYIEESDDNSTWFQIAEFVPKSSAGHLISATKTTTNQYQCVGLVTRRYLRERHVISGTSPNFAGVQIESRALGHDIPKVPSAT